jgi:hypothetical protein
MNALIFGRLSIFPNANGGRGARVTGLRSGAGECYSSRPHWTLLHRCSVGEWKDYRGGDGANKLFINSIHIHINIYFRSRRMTKINYIKRRR